MKTEQILQKLISIKSFSGQEDDIQKFIFKFIKSYNFKPFFVDKNLVVKIKGKNSKSALIFNSHVDTVSAGNLALWQNDPFSGFINDRKIYGLGSSDEKASVAVSLKLIEMCFGKVPDCDLWFTFVVNEEVDGSGTKEFIKWFSKKHMNQYKNIAGILGEPTKLEKTEIGHKGNLFIKATAIGDSGHGSEPQKIKKHAIKLIYRFVSKLDIESDIWSKKYKNEFLGIPTIALTAIAGGDVSSPNKFADTCVAVFDIRTTPEVHLKAFDLINKIAKDIDSELKIEFLYPPAPYGFTNPDEKIVKIAKEVTNTNIFPSFGSNDMYFFTEVGIPAIVFGPGEPSCIHKPNEYCEIENLDKCVNYYKEIIKEYSF